MQTIRELRERAGLSQKALAERLGVHYMSVYYWEAGRKMPAADQFRAMAQVFGVSMDDIVLPAPASEERDA